ncbi:MAG: response regulator [Bacteroidota bacterium]
MKNVLIADDHSIVRTGTANIIKKHYPSVAVFQANDFKEAYDTLSLNEIDVAVIDIKMPGGSPVDFVKQVTEYYPSIKILMFSGLDEAQYGSRFLKLGVKGFLSKHSPVEEVVNALKKIDQGDLYLSDDLKQKMENGFKKDKGTLDSLSTRELEILELLNDGYGNLEISRELDLKTSTVSTYKRRVVEKFQVNNTVELLDKYRDLLEQSKRDGDRESFDFY